MNRIIGIELEDLGGVNGLEWHVTTHLLYIPNSKSGSPIFSLIYFKHILLREISKRKNPKRMNSLE